MTHLAGQTIPFVSETSRVVQKTQFYFFSGIYLLLFIVAKHNFRANLTICKICVPIPYECFKEITIIALYCGFVYCFVYFWFLPFRAGAYLWALGILTIAPPINVYNHNLLNPPPEMLLEK